MSKPVPPPPPTRTARTFAPSDPIKPVRKGGGFTVNRTARPGVIRTRRTTDREIARMQRQDRFGR
jgi:hypothetical protein